MSDSTKTDEHEAFLRLDAEHDAALHSFVRSLVPTREDSREVMQEVLLVLRKKFDGVQEFRPWAFGVARNMVMRHLRARSRDRHVFDDELSLQLAQDAESSVERHTIQREALDRCLEKLPSTQRELVPTVNAKGVRIDEMAARRGQTPMALYKLLHRIRLSLLDCMQRSLAVETLT